MIGKSQSTLGNCCWAAFLKDGALRENSPNHTGLYREEWCEPSLLVYNFQPQLCLMVFRIEHIILK